MFGGKRGQAENERMPGGRKAEPKGKGSELGEEGVPETANAGAMG